jgi:hypothetical protein
MIAFVWGDEERRRIKQKMAQPNRAPVESNDCVEPAIQSASLEVDRSQRDKPGKMLRIYLYNIRRPWTRLHGRD